MTLDSETARITLTKVENSRIERIIAPKLCYGVN